MLDQQSAGDSLGLTVTFIFSNKPAHTVTIDRNRLPGLALVKAERDVMDRRQLHYYLTPKGEELLGEYLMHLRGGIS